MLRIVGIQRSNNPREEFVLLQNQGSMKVKLRGHVLLSDDAIDETSNAFHIFGEDEGVAPGMFVLLCTGFGTAHWSRTKDGGMVFTAYMNRTEPSWTHPERSLHILGTHHTYVTRCTQASVM